LDTNDTVPDDKATDDKATDQTSADETVTRGNGRSPSLAALLSFLWPGLGQLYLRNRRGAAIFAAPAFLVLLILLFELRQGYFVFGARFIDPSFSAAAAVLVVAFGVWRLAAVVHAFVNGKPSTSRKVLDRAVMVALVGVIAISHLGAGFLLAETSIAASRAFATPGPSSLIDFATPPPTPTPTLAPSQTPEPTPIPTPAPTIDKRITILLSGFDANITRPNELLYDSMMVVSFDPVTYSVQMINIPRDTTSFPMFMSPHQTLATSIRINSLWKYSASFGQGDAMKYGYTFLRNEIQYLVGVHIDKSVAMDLNGFVNLVDAVGGVDVNNPVAIDDYLYDWLDKVHFGFHLAAGPAHLDGKNALAYVRSRRGAGDNDFTRSSRQQEVMVSLFHQMTRPDQLFNPFRLQELIKSAFATVYATDMTPDDVVSWVGGFQTAFDSHGGELPTFTSVVLSPTAGYSNYYGTAVCLYNAKVAALSVKMFGKDSLWYGKPLPANTCPV
jgi:LCP family protein required for cell wall assembly